MKRKIVLGLIALGTASMLCGFDSAQTADSVLQSMQESAASSGSCSMDMGLNCDVAINVGDGTTTSSIAYLITGDFDIDEITNPLSMAMTGTVNVSGLGQSEALDMQVYEVIGEDGSMEIYSYTMDSSTEEGGWEYETIDASEITALTEQFQSSVDPSTLSEFGISFELAAEAADVDGTECYLLTSVIDSTTLATIVDKVSELSGEDLTANSDVSTMLTWLEGMQINVEYYVDTTTFLPVKVHVDLNSSDFSTLSSILLSYIGSSDTDTETTVEIVINDLSCDVTCSYDTVSEITVPEEAIAAIAAENTETEAATEAAADAAAEAAADVTIEAATEAVNEAVVY